jgi:spermidine dehydrogenase
MGSSKSEDDDLGLGRPIARRDFLNGVAMTVGASFLAPPWLRAMEGLAPGDAGTAYPPALTGLRGSHDGTYLAAHALRDGQFWKSAPDVKDAGEAYDLVVVGAGISGLSAAHFYRKAKGSRARILLLDNHDDFGGHARRNEFRHGERLVIAHGGTQAIDSPAPYSKEALALLKELGIDIGRWKDTIDEGAYDALGLKRATFFDRETFGADRLVVGDQPWTSEAAPLSARVKEALSRLDSDARDHFPGVPSSELKARLARLSYADYLTKVAGFDAGILPYLQARPHSLYGVGVEAVSALDAWGLEYPGFAGLKLDPGGVQGMNRDAIPRPKDAPEEFFHFPDGNATIARRLVQRLVPGVCGGATIEDVVTARFDYGRLDEAGAPARIRLGSTVVRVRHQGPEKARTVEVTYVKDGVAQAVRGAQVVLACWNGVIPHLCPELPAEQKAALADSTKVPLLYTSVFVRDWTAAARLKVRSVYSPGSYHTRVSLSPPVTVGGYRAPRRPEEPMALHLTKTPCQPGLPARDQHRAGRLQLLTATFADFERSIRDQLARTLGGGGFDPARDILAITVNRWPHGYAYQYNSLFDAFWRDGTEPPCVRARKPFGRIAIANADADAYSYTDAAIDQAWRAVGELLA